MDFRDRCLHAGLVILILGLLAVVPVATHFDVFGGGNDADAVSQASVVIPDQPSGEYLVLINAERHEDTLDEWEAFFTGDELAVIFEDISVLTARGDTPGEQMAERYMAQLPENQMTMRSEDATLLVSKVEAGYFDVAVFSAEMAASLSLDTEGNGHVMTVVVKEAAE